MAKQSASQTSTKSRRSVIGGIARVLLLGLMVVTLSTCTTKPKTFTQDLGNGVKLEMVEVPGGTFQMGSANGRADEKPVHQVMVSAFVMGKYEVTQAQWQAVMGNNPSELKGDDLPVESVSWEEAQEFCRKLSSQTGNHYRLPTEAEWEYACRAGTTGDYADLDATAWYGGKMHPVGQIGQKQPNAWGLYDMRGNAWEWCQDWYDSNYYSQSPATNPQGPSSGSSRVYRGACWFIYASGCRTAFRANNSPGFRDGALGFRLVRTTTPKEEEKKEAVQSPTPKVDRAESLQPKTFTEDLGNGVKLEMVEVPGGTFQMGSPEAEKGRHSWEGPQHQVTVSAFAIGKYEVTQKQWQAVMGNNPSNFKGDDLPVEEVSWNEAKEFCQKLSRQTSKNYRLPTEAEWEYACRAGTTGAYAGTLDEMGWYKDNSGGKKHAVGQKKPNAFGLYDMHGNVWEWCSDWYGSYASMAVTDPVGASSGSYRVIRGGGWIFDAVNCRSAERFRRSLDDHAPILGFRLVRTSR